MFAGNVRGALNYLSQKFIGTPLKPNDIIATKDGGSETVQEALSPLHPKAKPVDFDALMEDTSFAR